MKDRLPDRCAQRFEVQAVLGAGSMGLVYRALQVSLGRPVALKVGHSNVASEGDLRRFELEARLTSRVTDPGIPVVYDHGIDEGIPWIAYELLPGPDLESELARTGPLPLGRAIEIGIQVLFALEVAHQAGVIHRDLKPANIVAAGPDRWKLTDFGIARWRGCGALMSSPGTFVGTARYTSPEQALGVQVVEASDLYSLGCVLFEMITGRPPFLEASFAACLRSHARNPPPAPSAVCPGLPCRVDEVLLRALAKPLSIRFSSATEMLGDLEELQDELAALGTAVFQAAGAPGSRPDSPTEAASFSRLASRSDAPRPTSVTVQTVMSDERGIGSGPTHVSLWGVMLVALIGLAVGAVIGVLTTSGSCSVSERPTRVNSSPHAGARLARALPSPP